MIQKIDEAVAFVRSRTSLQPRIVGGGTACDPFPGIGEAIFVLMLTPW